MTVDQALILSLRMKAKTSSLSGVACMIDPDDAIDFLHVMVSKEEVYKCRDYLGRRGTKVQRDKYLESGIECASPEIEDAIDITCREKMCEWSYRVCDFFHTNREIVALSFSLLDRFLGRCTSCDRTVFKLASMTTLFMAAKIFNTKKISIDCLVELSRGEFDMSHLAEMERIILKALDWRVNPPTVQSFIGYLLAFLPLHDARCARSIRQRAIFFAELCCFDYRFVTQDRSLIAVSCILNALEGMDTDDVDVSRDVRRQDFLETIRSKLSLEFEGEEMETSQGRLLHLYTCSSQVEEDKILPLHVSKERLVKQNSQNNNLLGGKYSPVSVSTS